MKSDEFLVTESMGQYTAYELLTGSTIVTLVHFKTKPFLWTDMLDDTIFPLIPFLETLLARK